MLNSNSQHFPESWLEAGSAQVLQHLMDVAILVVKVNIPSHRLPF